MMDSPVPDLSAFSTPGRWVRLGPYYAMFPVDYVMKTIRRYGKPGHAVIDPFCGRGTVPFIAMTMGLPLSRQTSVRSLGSTQKPRPIRTQGWGQSSSALRKSKRAQPRTIGAQRTNFRRWRSAAGC